MEQHGNYLIKPIKDIGSGGFGRVELVELYTLSGNRCTSNERYARKLLSVHEDLIDDIYSYNDWKRRFQREVIYQTRCNHENIVPIYLHDLYGDSPWFVMELAEGSLTDDLLEGVIQPDGSRRHLSSEQKIDIIRMVLNGVEHMHSKDYIHRDLKPDNILRYSDGCYKVSDFGLVKNADSSRESAMISNIMVVLGTEIYMSPESKLGLFTKHSDIYSLGVIIDQMNIIGIKGIDDLVRKSTHYKPTDRFSSVSEMLQTLETIHPRSIK